MRGVKLLGVVRGNVRAPSFIWVRQLVIAQRVVIPPLQQARVGWVETIAETHQGMADGSYDYDGYNDIGGKGIDKMIDQLIARHDELPVLPAERSCLFFHRCTGGAKGRIAHRKHPWAASCFPRGQVDRPVLREVGHVSKRLAK